MNVMSVSGSGSREGKAHYRRIAQTENAEADDGMTLLIQQYVAAEKDWQAAKRALPEAFERYKNCRRLMIKAGFVLDAERGW